MNRPLATAAICLASGVALAAAASTEVPFHTIDAQLDPASGQLHIVDEVQLAGYERYAFRLAPWLQLLQLKVDGVTGEADDLAGAYAVTLPDRGRHTLRIETRGTIPPRDGPADSANASSGADGAYVPGFAAWVPLSADARMRYRLNVVVPAGQLAVATGKLVAERADADAYRATFLAERPVEAPSLFAGPYAVRERQRPGVRLRAYLHPELLDLADDYLRAADRYIERYATSIGAYPYADFHIISAPLPVGLGFPNLTYVGRRVLPLPFMRTRSLAHEVLHNWWGNGVAVDYAGGNWSEGLTTYMADYALAAEQGGEAAQAMRVKWLRDYAALPPERDAPVLDFRSRQHQAAQVVGYNKVAFIFHMLKAEIGEPAFTAGLRRFWAMHALKTAGWQDLQAAFEHTSGRALDWFFTQWLTRTGAPRLALGASEVRRRGSAYEVRIELRQSAPHYRLALPVSLATQQGTVVHLARVEDALTVLEIDSPSLPLAVHVDPASEVFRRLTSAETPPILRDVTLHPATITLIATQDPEYREVAQALADRLLDTVPRPGTLVYAQAALAPVLLIAPAADAQNILAKLDAGERPALPAAAYSAAAWTTRRGNGQPVLVVTAPNARALRDLLRPLPHYGGQSYVLFDEGKATAKGVWPITSSALRRRLTE